MEHEWGTTGPVTASSSAGPLVAMHGITKRYGGVQACREIDLTLAPGEVHALLGENGAGKSTLMKILSGDITDYEGRIEVAGQPRRFSGPADAQTAGIAIIHQELDLVPALSVADNVFLGRELRRHGRLDRAAMATRTRELLERIGVRLEPRRLVEELRTGEQQLVVIAKALSLHARVLIMDEPTSALSSSEVDRLFEVTRELRRDGVGIIYISHRMDEISRIADRATVLRNGRVAATFDPRTMTTSQVVEAMVGRPVQEVFSTPDTMVGEELLRVENLAVHPRHVPPGRQDPDGISLTVHAGEIVGLAGVEGNGQRALADVLSSLVPLQQGTVHVGGRAVVTDRPGALAAAGVGVIPEDRHDSGCVLGMTVAENLTMSDPRLVARRGVVDRKALRQRAARLMSEFEISAPGPDTPMRLLSGGNQQRVVLARELSASPTVLVAAQPTHGLDVGAIEYMGARLRAAAESGVGVLLISNELEEILALAHRIVVVHRGRVVGEMARAEADLERLGMLMGGAAA